MIRRLLIFCTTLLLLLCITVQVIPAAPPGPDMPAIIPWPVGDADWEVVGAQWAPDPLDLVTEMEFTMQTIYPSDESGLFTTEIHLSTDCPGCEYPVTIQVMFWMHDPHLRPWDPSELWFCVLVLEPSERNWYAIFPVNMGLERRYHQFRFRIRKYMTPAFRLKMWDCDTDELLYNQYHGLYTDPIEDIDYIVPHVQQSYQLFDAKFRWEGHWVKLYSEDVHRWDVAPWDIDGMMVINKDEADRIGYDPVKHVYDDHPEACTSGYYWPTAFDQDDDDEVPLFEATGPIPVDPADAAMLPVPLPKLPRSAEVEAPVVLEPLDISSYANASYLSHVLNGLEGQAHWNRLDIWYYNYY